MINVHIALYVPLERWFVYTRKYLIIQIWIICTTIFAFRCFEVKSLNLKASNFLNFLGTSNQVHRMKRIPVELLLNLSKFLSIRDRLRLRCVCKEWRSFIDEFCLDELVLFLHVHPTLELWSYNSKPIEFRNLVFLQSCGCLWEDGFKYVFRNVKRLFLCIWQQEDAAYRLGE